MKVLDYSLLWAYEHMDIINSGIEKKCKIHESEGFWKKIAVC